MSTNTESPPSSKHGGDNALSRRAGECPAADRQPDPVMANDGAHACKRCVFNPPSSCSVPPSMWNSTRASAIAQAIVSDMTRRQSVDNPGADFRQSAACILSSALPKRRAHSSGVLDISDFPCVLRAFKHQVAQKSTTLFISDEFRFTHIDVGRIATAVRGTISAQASFFTRTKRSLP